MADEEKKPEGQPEAQPAGGAPENPPAPNPGPSADELLKQKQELEEKLKEKDTKIADLENTRATIEARQRQIDEAKIKQTTDEELKAKIKSINERRAYDPDGADAEMASLLTEVKTQSAKSAVEQAQAIISQQTTIEKLKMSIKSSNPEFDDDIVDLTMQKANQLASSGKYKTADEAIRAATDFVKSKLDGYAKKKNAAPPLPDGARAEGGGANQPPKPPEPPKEKSPLEEIEELNATKMKKLM
jgi:type VI protein secretion system component VasK